MKNSSIILSLLVDIAEGDTGAFSRFYDLFYPSIYKFSRYFTKSEELCKEIVSDVFYNLWQSRKNLKHIDNIENYIFIVTKNQAIKYHTNKTKHQYEPVETLPGEFFIETSTPENALMNKELGEVLTKAINELPERCKLIFLLAREQNLKHKEIAEILSISEHTVHAQLTIASKKIAEILENIFD